MVIYREQNANTPTKGNDGIIEVERTVYQSTGKDGEDVVTITKCLKRKKGRSYQRCISKSIISI